MRNILTVLLMLHPLSMSLAHDSSEPLSEYLVVESVSVGSPAAAAGLRIGDELFRMAGRELSTIDDLREVMAAHEAGDEVPLEVRREGRSVDLALTFVEGPSGGVAMGVSLEVPQGPAGEAGTAGEPTRGTTECLAWIEEKYRIGTMLETLDMDFSGEYEELLACVARDTQRMASEDAVRYCDNVFKVHCSALDLMTEIGEAQVDWCEASLGDALGIDAGKHRGWRTCGEHAVYDRYAIDGEASDAEACRSTYLDECGRNLDAAVATRQLSAQQREFVECCSADTLGSEPGCSMIDSGFARGPCHDREVCVSSETSEWLTCSELR
jgi:hypothetical protein